ncbi:N-6 DNA methylase [Flavobacterium arundinis]|uniref:N-6 DNA methylase n=1 Tax=Flavobacterium arundinis TaxID=3139143 RepID=UPI00311F0B3D
MEDNDLLTEKLQSNVYYYECPPQTKTSFYIILETLSDQEFDELRKYIWNEDKADLIFITNEKLESDVIINLYYGKISPNLKISDYKLDSFKGSDAGNEKIDKINKWNFDSGLFWLNYKSFIDRVRKSKSIDRELIFTLERLKKDLYNVVANDEIVQALIDRTLYIKYLEDNHIINSYFYSHYFGDFNITYKELLNRNDIKSVNNLFKIINEIFNNYLFITPEINQEYLNNTVFDLIYHSISGTSLTGQLSLFDFKFNVIPVEFISYIYEVFLKEEQKENGIFYTPKKLAQLIIDDVIIDDKIGRVLDPSCGSGMFLIVAFQKLLENSPIEFNDVEKKIEHRIRLLSENIFGIEKRSIAQRFTIFSLSLQIFRDLNPDEIKEFINGELRSKNRVDLFGNYSFFENIICHNSLDIIDEVFREETFDYIVGNPPFFEIKNTDEEIAFISNYKTVGENTKVTAKEIVGSHQISQCFFLKIKDWSNINTRFGFVTNNSNFYNDNSRKFQSFFYSNYRIEKIYELSKVKKILFENAEESVSAIIFNNLLIEDNCIEYYPVEMGLFSEKPFELLVIQEDKLIDINQQELVENRTRLRDFLLGNKYDKELLLKINSNQFLSDYIKLKTDNSQFLHRGFELWGEDARKKEFNLNKEDWKNLPSEKKKEFVDIFVDKYFTDDLTETHLVPYVKPKNLEPFLISNANRYISTLDNFHRPRTLDIYEGDKIIISRLGDNLNAVYSKEKIFFDFSIYIFKLREEKLYYLITAILNSELCNYYINQYLRKRVND